MCILTKFYSAIIDDSLRFVGLKYIFVNFLYHFIIRQPVAKAKEESMKLAQKHLINYYLNQIYNSTTTTYKPDET